ncbi:hypothetical protein [Bacillus sp. V5-8f]|uniref:hypothetical protein n=1 Tax=Bacillus sp. V5-8f TaxID=2053044 RepID=UPI000C76BA52|nr:hypothetical protein [Bacillus sp. V5-8f]PLT33154.1 hypothetical protein CUU64_15360 [Bacillus sp. V5-8f]
MQEVAIWKELERFNILCDEKVSVENFAKDLSSVFELAQQRTNASKPHAMASVLMRNAAFVYVSQLFILSKYRMKWSGDYGKVGLLDGDVNGRWSPMWVFPQGEWVPVEGDAETHSALQTLICDQCRQLIKAVAKATKSSPFVLWENVWGYMLWMYVQLFQESSDIADRARKDIEYFLRDETWRGLERRSPFQKFLTGQTPEESMANYARITCCLYYMIPGNDKCPYCPKVSNDRCLI